MVKSSKVEKDKESSAKEKTEEVEAPKEQEVPKEKPWHPRQLFVSGIPYSATEKELRDFFKDMGDSVG